MKFKDVPVGHVFRLMECDCMFRRATVLQADGKDAYVLVEPCSKHDVNPRFKWRPLATRVGFADPDEEVRYDPLAAMLEEQWGSAE
jgi:hypothetical protein